jgi:hypothetical protein
MASLRDQSQIPGDFPSVGGGRGGGRGIDNKGEQMVAWITTDTPKIGLFASSPHSKDTFPVLLCKASRGCVKGIVREF